MNSSSGESGSGDLGRRDLADRRPGSPVESRPEAWRLILADGSRTSAPGRADETSAAHPIGPGTPPGQAGFRPASRGDHGGEELETLADFLQDEDLTLLDLDLLSCDLSLLSAEMVRVEEAPNELPGHGIAEESAAQSDRELSQVIAAWPRLSTDFRQAILWIANGGL